MSFQSQAHLHDRLPPYMLQTRFYHDLPYAGSRVVEHHGVSTFIQEAYVVLVMVGNFCVDNFKVTCPVKPHISNYLLDAHFTAQ